jgi:hypothetical protein
MAKWSYECNRNRNVEEINIINESISWKLEEPGCISQWLLAKYRANVSALSEKILCEVILKWKLIF